MGISDGVGGQGQLGSDPNKSMCVYTNAGYVLGKVPVLFYLSKHVFLLNLIGFLRGY